MERNKDEETTPAEEQTTAAEEESAPAEEVSAAEASPQAEAEAAPAEAAKEETAPEEAAAEEAAPAEAAPEETAPAAEAVDSGTGESEAAEGAEPESAEPESAEPESAEPEATETHAPAEPAAEAEPVRTLIELAADARYSATGKRKSAVARVILLPGSGAFLLNGKPLDSYFPRKTLQEVVRQPLKVTGYLDRVDIRARIHGGGISSQADAVRHGIAKALIEADPNLRGDLKRKQLLTRDPRVKERRKAGLKKARKRPQFSKR
jgi:small subunit ribosomal protein S9